MSKPKRYFIPTVKYIPGTSIITAVKRWEWSAGKGLWVVYKDGLTCKCDCGLKEFLDSNSVHEVSEKDKDLDFEKILERDR